METQNENYYRNDNLGLEEAVEGILHQDTAVDKRGILVGRYGEETEGHAAGNPYIGDTDINRVLDDIDGEPDEDDDLEDDDLDDDLVDDDLLDDDDLDDIEEQDTFDEPFDIDDDLSLVDEDLDDEDDFKDDDFTI